MKTVFFKMPVPVWSIKATLVVLYWGVNSRGNGLIQHIAFLDFNSDLQMGI